MDERQIGGLWCHEVLALLDAYVEGDLTPSEVEAVRTHVTDCDQCARFGEAYARTVAALRAAPETELDDTRRERLAARLEKDR